MSWNGRSLHTGATSGQATDGFMNSSMRWWWCERFQQLFKVSSTSSQLDHFVLNIRVPLRAFHKGSPSSQFRLGWLGSSLKFSPSRARLGKTPIFRSPTLSGHSDPSGNTAPRAVPTTSACGRRMRSSSILAAIWTAALRGDLLIPDAKWNGFLNAKSSVCPFLYGSYQFHIQIV